MAILCALFGIVSSCDPFEGESWPPTRLGDKKVTLLESPGLLFLLKLAKHAWRMGSQDSAMMVMVLVPEGLVGVGVAPLPHGHSWLIMGVILTAYQFGGSSKWGPKKKSSPKGIRKTEHSRTSGIGLYFWFHGKLKSKTLKEPLLCIVFCSLFNQPFLENSNQLLMPLLRINQPPPAQPSRHHTLHAWTVPHVRFHHRKSWIHFFCSKTENPDTTE